MCSITQHFIRALCVGFVFQSLSLRLWQAKYRTTKVLSEKDGQIVCALQGRKFGIYLCYLQEAQQASCFSALQSEHSLSCLGSQGTACFCLALVTVYNLS